MHARHGRSIEEGLMLMYSIVRVQDRRRNLREPARHVRSISQAPMSDVSGFFFVIFLNRQAVLRRKVVVETTRLKHVTSHVTLKHTIYDTQINKHQVTSNRHCNNDRTSKLSRTCAADGMTPAGLPTVSLVPRQNLCARRDPLTIPIQKGQCFQRGKYSGLGNPCTRHRLPSLHLAPLPAKNSSW